MELIETTHLKLQPFQKSETALFLRINRDRSVRKYLWDDIQISEQQADEILVLNQRHFERDHYGLWKIYRKDNVQIMGYAGLWHFFEEAQPQLIYSLLPEFCGNGWATEASAAIMRYAFDSLEFPDLVASMDEGHADSEKVAKRIGMVFWKRKVIDGKPTVFYRVLAN